MSLHRPFPGQCPYVVRAGVVPVVGAMLLLVVVAVEAVVVVVAVVVAFLDDHSTGHP